MKHKDKWNQRLALAESLQALAEIKALAILISRDLDKYNNQAEAYGNKAILLLKKAEEGKLGQQEADLLASKALVRKAECLGMVSESRRQLESLRMQIAKMDSNIEMFKSYTGKRSWRAEAFEETSNVAKQMLEMSMEPVLKDINATVAMLERMKEKVAEEEALIQAYQELADDTDYIDLEIDNALQKGETEMKVKNEMDSLKRTLGLKPDH